jgi:tetratricopeptide (TPR) repeat protein
MNIQIIRRITAALVLWAALAPGLCVRAAHGQTQSTNIAGDAYKLRMRGKVDEARILLEKTIREDPRDAAANYELARTMVHIALGNPRSMTQSLAEAQKCMATAEEDDPNNAIYPFFDGHIALLQAYPSLMQNRPDTREKIARLCGAFESALKLKPDYRQAMLYLVEIYGTLPENQGGDKSKAEKYAGQLEGMDAVFGAKARSILMPEDANNVEYWQKVLQQHEGDADVLEELGKAYLRADKVDDAVACFDEAIKVDPGRAYLFLDLSIYHTWSAMRAGEGSELFRKAVASGDAAVTRYLESNPVQPMRAYALGVQFKYKLHSGHNEQGNELLKQARALDPYFSMATGAPNPDLFIPPDEVSHNHRYLFRPIQ